MGVSLPRVKICADQLLHTDTADGKLCVVGVPWEKSARERDFSDTGLLKPLEKRGEECREECSGSFKANCL